MERKAGEILLDIGYKKTTAADASSPSRNHPPTIEIPSNTDKLLKLPYNSQVLQHSADEAAEDEELLFEEDNNELEIIPEEESSRERGSREQVITRTNLLNGICTAIEVHPLEPVPGQEVARVKTPKTDKKRKSINRGKSAEVIRVANVLRNAL